MCSSSGSCRCEAGQSEQPRSALSALRNVVKASTRADAGFVDVLRSIHSPTASAAPVLRIATLVSAGAGCVPPIGSALMRTPPGPRAGIATDQVAPVVRRCVRDHGRRRRAWQVDVVAVTAISIVDVRKVCRNSSTYLDSRHVEVFVVGADTSRPAAQRTHPRLHGVLLDALWWRRAKRSSASQRPRLRDRKLQSEYASDPKLRFARISVPECSSHPPINMATDIPRPVDGAQTMVMAYGLWLTCSRWRASAEVNIASLSAISSADRNIRAEWGYTLPSHTKMLTVVP